MGTNDHQLLRGSFCRRPQPKNRPRGSLGHFMFQFMVDCTVFHHYPSKV